MAAPVRSNTLSCGSHADDKRAKMLQRSKSGVEYDIGESDCPQLHMDQAKPSITFQEDQEELAFADEVDKS